MMGLLSTSLRVTALFLAVFGTATNALTFLVFVCSRKLRRPVNLFIIALAVTDFVISINEGLGCVQLLAGIRLFRGRSCSAQGIIMDTAGLMSIDAIGATAAVRYLIIVHQAKSKTLVVWKYCWVFMACIFIHVAIGLIPVFTPWSKFAYITWLGICSLDNAEGIEYMIYLSCINLLPPYVMLIFMYWSIYRVYRKSRNAVTAHAGGTGVQTGVKRHELRLTLQTVIISVIFTISLSFTSVALFGDNAKPYYDFCMLMQQVTFCFNAAINPVIYLYFNRHFKAESGRLLCSYLKRQTRPLPHSLKTHSVPKTTACQQTRNSAI